MFYTYNQNNSGGKFIQDDKIGKYVIVEGNSPDDADRRAQTVGIYFDGCDHGIDCSCCGDRWSPTYGEGTWKPTIYGQTFKEYEDSLDYALEKRIVVHVYYKDGRHDKIVIEAEKAIKRNKARKQSQAAKLWAISFNLSGLYSNKPIRVFEHDIGDASRFYDAEGNFCIEKVGLWKEPTYGSVYYASQSKADVEAFMDGIVLGLQAAKQAAESAILSNCYDKGPLKDGMEAVVSRLGQLLGE